MTNFMTFKGYTASMVFDTEDKIIVGRVQDVDDIISFHGESVSVFESNFHAVIDDYLAASKELGSAPEKPASGKVMLRIAPEVHAAALKAAARSGKSLNKWAESAVNLTNQALSLPVQQRAELAAQLLSSLDALTEQEIEALWLQEAAHRASQIDQGLSKLIPAEEVRRQVNALLK